MTNHIYKGESWEQSIGKITTDDDTNDDNSTTAAVAAVPNPDNTEVNIENTDDEKLTDVLPGEDDPVDCEERELEVKDDWPPAEFEK